MSIPFKKILDELKIKGENSGACSGGANGRLKPGGPVITSYSPVDGKPIANIRCADADAYEQIVSNAHAAFNRFRMMPAPKRGEIVRDIGNALREKKEALGSLIAYETGKIKAEGMGEVQEMIDIADFALGLSRQLYGLTMHSERPGHRMYEQWHPLGPVGIITAFNFPAAVWSWNALIACVCGDCIIFKPSSKAPLTAIAIQNLLSDVVDRYDINGVFNLLVGERDIIGNAMLDDKRIPLISATGSTRMGRVIASRVGQRLGRTILELGGNNAIIVAEDCNLEMAVKATLFGAVGTAGQRCTSTRRIILHKDVQEPFLKMLIQAYKQIPIGNPLEDGILMGPLIDRQAKKTMMKALEDAEKQGGTILYGGNDINIKGFEKGHYVTPAVVLAKNHYPIVQTETFAPILYIIPYSDFKEALQYHNDVPQGLSSAVFTRSLHYQEHFLSHEGSDCGLANVNIGTSGAEIGGAFGGEKETGGGRESGSDAWKSYMRRQTNTINWSHDMPLAQGIDFSIET